MQTVLKRRSILCLGGAALAAGVASPALAIGRTACRSIALYNLHTGERRRLDYWVDGNYVPGALDAANHVLRDYRNNEVHPIAPKLLDLVNILQRQLGST